MTTPTPTPATMNSKWWGSRFIMYQAPGTIATSPCHHSTCHPHFHHHLHTLPFMSEVSPIPKSVSSTSQTTSTTIVCSSLASSHHLSVAPSTTPTSYLKGKFPHLFFFIFLYTNHLEHQVHSCHPTPPSLSIPPANTQWNRLETCLCLDPKIFFFFFIYIVLMFIYCHHQTCHNGHHILMIATSPPHQHTQQQKGLDLLLKTYLKPLVGFFFLLFLQY